MYIYILGWFLTTCINFFVGNLYQPPYHFIPFGEKTFATVFHEDWMISRGASSPLNIYGFFYGKIMHTFSIDVHRKSLNSILAAVLKKCNTLIKYVMLLFYFKNIK